VQLSEFFLAGFARAESEVQIFGPAAYSSSREESARLAGVAGNRARVAFSIVATLNIRPCPIRTARTLERAIELIL